MFSGGLDSTGMLYRLLTDPEYGEYNIHVHHVKMCNRENRQQAESIAVENIIGWFHNNGMSNFRYTENTIDFEFLKHGNFPWDSDVTNFVAGNIVKNKKNTYKYIAFGRTKNDTNRTITSLSNDILEGVLRGRPVEKIYPITDLTKEELWDYLPEELREYTWSCRRPKYIDGVPTACGRCVPCKDLKHIK
jgi:7-cyano-7-deazaguanine synthase in queuosine biosynthesis